MISTEIQLAADRTILALCTWREARSLGRPAMTAITEVFINRLRSDKWPAYNLWDLITRHFVPSINGYQSTQSLWPKWDDPMWELALLLADQALTPASPKTNLIKNGDSYYSTVDAQPPWAIKATFITQIGKFRFYHVGYDHETVTKK